MMTDRLKREWQKTAARLADLAGWACFDAGEQPNVAQRYFLTAIQLAGEAGDVQQRTHTATSMSRHLTYNGRTAEALSVIDMARLGWRELPPLGRAVIGIVEARVHGKMGNAQACHRAVDLCDDNFAASPLGGSQDPVWGYYADAGQILGDAGHALFDLAMNSGDEDQADATINRLEAAYATHPPEVSRSKALTMIRIACLKARHHDTPGACDAAEIGVDDARQVRSHRVTHDLQQLNTVLNVAPDRKSVAERIDSIRADIGTLTRIAV
jgi:hypothetical protein